MAQIKLDDQTICQTSSNLEITGVVVSASGPWGYNAGTKILTIPDNSLALTGSPTWGDEPGNDTSFLSFPQLDGSLDFFVKRVHARGSQSQQSNSFQDNGVGLEIIHSSETSNILPASPAAIPNAAGITGRKYLNSKYYLWFDDTTGKFTYWWDGSSSWRPVLQNHNVLIVNGKGGGNFTKLTDAYAYLTALPTYSGVPPISLGPRRPSADNIWTVLIYNRVSETIVVNAHDYINVVFMPGAQLYVNANSTRSVLFDGGASSPIRYTANKFSAVWAAFEKTSLTDFSTSTSLGNGNFHFHIIGVLTNSLPVGQAIIEINDMKEIALSGLSVYSEQGTSTRSGIVVKITGASTDATNPRKKNVILKDMTLICGSNEVSGNTQYGVIDEHTSGNVYIDDCVIASDSGSLSPVFAMHIGTSGYTYINECFVMASITAQSYALYIPGSATLVAASGVFATHCVFEGYGDSSTGYGGAAAYINSSAQFSKCIFRIPRRFEGSPSGNALTVGLAASSACVYTVIRDTQQARFDECYFFGDLPTSCGLSIGLSGTWADTKVVLNKCSVFGRLASVASLTGTTGTTKRMYGCSFEGPIAGTPFGCAAATATLATNYRV